MIEVAEESLRDDIAVLKQEAEDLALIFNAITHKLKNKRGKCGRVAF